HLAAAGQRRLLAHPGDALDDRLADVLRRTPLEHALLEGRQRPLRLRRGLELLAPPGRGLLVELERVLRGRGRRRGLRRSRSRRRLACRLRLLGGLVLGREVVLLTVEELLALLVGHGLLLRLGRLRGDLLLRGAPARRRRLLLDEVAEEIRVHLG